MSTPQPLPSNPFERYRILRRERPVSREPGEPWRVACYADVRPGPGDRHGDSVLVGVRVQPHLDVIELPAQQARGRRRG